MSEQDYRIGDAGTAFDYNYTDEAGDPVSLTGQTVQLIFKAPSGALKTRAAVLVSGDLVARYVLISSDFDEEGIWYREFHATGVSFTDATQPVPFYVAARLSSS